MWGLQHGVHCRACSANICASVQAVASAGSMEELRTLLAELELSVHAEYISPHFRHIPPAVPGAWLPPAAAPLPEAAQEGSAAASDAEASEAARRLAWLPATNAALSLRLASFDAAVVYVPGMPPARDSLQVCLPHSCCSPSLALRLEYSCRPWSISCPVCAVLQHMLWVMRKAGKCFAIWLGNNSLLSDDNYV